MKSKLNEQKFSDCFNCSAPHFSKVWNMEHHLMSDLEQACVFHARQSKRMAEGKKGGVTLESNERLMLQTVEKIIAFRARLAASDDAADKAFIAGGHSRLDDIAAVIAETGVQDPQKLMAALKPLLISDVDLDEKPLVPFPPLKKPTPPAP